MAIAFIFLLGIGNFALHRAVMASRHPLVGQISWFASRNGRRIALGFEFLVLVSAMWFAANGWPGMAWGYFIYSLLNGASGWLILSGKI